MAVNLLKPMDKLFIADKSAGLVRFGDVMNYAQRELIQHTEDNLRDQKRTRAIVLKARQIGISTAVEGMMFTLALGMPRMKGLVMSHEKDSAKHLLSMTHTYWDTFWAKELFTSKSLAVNHMSWVETDSSIRVATAGNKMAGRSTTVQFLHASEVGFWPAPEELMLNLNQSVPSSYKSFIIMESTANGRGNYFYQQWHAAVAGDTEYTPFFFPWWKHPQYTAEFVGITDSLTDLDTDERSLKAVLAGEGLSSEDIDSRLKWRRHGIANLAGGDLLDFQQEYPAHPEEAFISTGTNVFPDKALRLCYQPTDPDQGFLARAGNRVEFQEDNTGELAVYSYPSPDKSWGKYVVFADPSRTTKANSDYAVIQVMNRRTWEQVAVWRGKVDTATLADKIIELALWYNDAIANCETTGPGYGTMGALTAYGYPHLWKTQRFNMYVRYGGTTYGWESNMQTKHAYIGYLKKAINEGTVVVHDRTTYQELVDYVVEDTGFGPADKENGNDDCVTSFAGALITVITTATDLSPHEPMGTVTYPEAAPEAVPAGPYKKRDDAIDAQSEDYQLDHI